MRPRERESAAYDAVRTYLLARAVHSVGREEAEEAVQAAWLGLEEAFGAWCKARRGQGIREARLYDEHGSNVDTWRPNERRYAVRRKWEAAGVQAPLDVPVGAPCTEDTGARIDGLVRAPKRAPIDVGRALRLRAEGRTWDEIGEEMGHHRTNIIHAVRLRGKVPYGLRGRKKKSPTP